VVAFGIGWVISGYTLRPIHRITQTARMIGNESDFSKRVVYTGPNDEVGQLAITFNSMLTRLQDAYQKVSHALSMQRDFVADVSHELRTPLTTVRGNLELLLLREPPLPDEEKEDILTDIVEESDRLIRLVNDLLLLARADSRQSTTREQIPLPALIDETVRQARRIDPQREIILDVQDVTAMGDRDALKQVILILIDNALKHSQAKITVSAGVADSQVLICVRDEGPGMTQETLNHVFERFHRGEDRTVPGFGLGLPIAKALVEGQDGSITIQSQPGKGCTVQVFLPAHLTT